MLKNKSKAIKFLKMADPVLGEIIEKTKLPKRKRRDDYFLSLCHSIVGQQLSVKAAATIWERVVGLFPKQAPMPKQFIKMPAAKLRKAGLSGSKVKYLKNLAKFAIAYAEQFGNMNKMSDEQAIEFLTQIKGVGRWTAEMFLIFTLGREDIFSHADLGLQNAIRALYKLRKKPSLKIAKRISDKWKPYRSHASLYLWASLS